MNIKVIIMSMILIIMVTELNNDNNNNFLTKEEKHWKKIKTKMIKIKKILKIKRGKKNMNKNSMFMKKYLLTESAIRYLHFIYFVFFRKKNCRLNKKTKSSWVIHAVVYWRSCFNNLS